MCVTGVPVHPHKGWQGIEYRAVLNDLCIVEDCGTWELIITKLYMLAELIPVDV